MALELPHGGKAGLVVPSAVGLASWQGAGAGRAAALRGGGLAGNVEQEESLLNGEDMRTRLNEDRRTLRKRTSALALPAFVARLAACLAHSWTAGHALDGIRFTYGGRGWRGGAVSRCRVVGKAVPRKTEDDEHLARPAVHLGVALGLPAAPHLIGREQLSVWPSRVNGKIARVGAQ